jgi:hypothetical protein
MIEHEDIELSEARKTLLQHFSSKSTLQATILLSLIIAFFTFVQTITFFQKWNTLFLCLFYSLVLTSFMLLTVRALGKLIYYAGMAGLVDRISINGKEEGLKNTLERDEKPFVVTYLHLVGYTCDEYLRCASRVKLHNLTIHVIFKKLTNEPKGLTGSFLVICPLFVSFFGYLFQIPDVPIIGVIVSILALLTFVANLKGWLCFRKELKNRN